MEKEKANCEKEILAKFNKEETKRDTINKRLTPSQIRKIRAYADKSHMSQMR